MSNESFDQPDTQDQIAYPSLVEMYQALYALASGNPAPIQRIDDLGSSGERMRRVSRVDWRDELADAEARVKELTLQAAETRDIGAVVARNTAILDLSDILKENPDGPPKP